MNAIRYVLTNAQHHYGERGNDPFSSAALEPGVRATILVEPISWLLRVGWKRARSG